MLVECPSCCCIWPPSEMNKQPVVSHVLCMHMSELYIFLYSKLTPRYSSKSYQDWDTHT